MPDFLTFGEKVNDLRCKLGLSQKEFGEILGVSHSTISMYEQNIAYPKYAVLQKMREHFGVSIDYMMGLPDESISDKVDSTHVSIEGISYSLRDIITLVSNMTEDELSDLVRCIRIIKDDPTQINLREIIRHFYK